MPKAVIIIAVGLFFIIMTALLALLSSRFRKNDSIIRKDEVAASARILEIYDTGNRNNSNPVVELKLEVQPENALPYKAEVMSVVSVVDLPAFQPDAVIRVKFRKSKPANIIVIGR